MPLDEDAGGADVQPDVHHRDTSPPEEDAAEEDALPPIDVSPPIDVFTDCPDAGSTLIYVITTQNTLSSFYPPTATFNTIGKIACPAITGSTPFSMAVDRDGIARIVFYSGELFRVSTLTAACQPTGFVRNQQGFSTTFGMGYSKDAVGKGETLYVASDEMGAPARLASIDTQTYALGIVGAFSPSINRAELTGTGAGQLFGFYGLCLVPPCDPNNPPDSAVVEIDKSTAMVTGQSNLPGFAQGGGWAFAFWGGDFYLFTAPNRMNPTSIVTRFRPSDGSLTPVAQTAETIVGAGVSTCAPQQ